MPRSSVSQGVLRLIEVSWGYIDKQVSPYLSRGLLDIGLTYLPKTTLDQDKLRYLAQLVRLEAKAEDEEQEKVKGIRKQLEKDLLGQGGWRLWFAGAWVVVSVQAPWSLFVTLSMLVSVPVVIAIHVFK